MQRERALASEKDTLLRELQHRVKNNMGIISSIASIEAREAASPEAKAALAKLASRIGALGALYDTLYNLEVSDNGIGLPLGFAFESARGFGMNLVALLANQLEGEVEAEIREGTRITVSFVP